MKNNYIEKLHMLFFTRHLLSKKNIKKLQKNIFYTESSRKPFQLSTKKNLELTVYIYTDLARKETHILFPSQLCQK